MFYPELSNQFFDNPELKGRLKSIYGRDQEKELPNRSFQFYEYNLSHTRAIARLSDGTDKQYFQGSSINRKKRDKCKKESAQAPAETLNQSFFEAVQYRRKFNKLFRTIEDAGKRKHNKTTENVMSRRTKIKVKEKMLALYAASKKTFSFITLTMINDCADTLAVKLLNKFLTAVRKKEGLFNYVWVAERQTKTTNRIHFHMILDKRFDIDYINSLWIVQQYNAGIQHETAHIKLYNDYGKTFKQLHKSGEIGQKLAHKYLNPVDVVKVKTINGVSAYLTNYVLKNETKMSCAVWHCNRNVSRLFTKQLISQLQFDFTTNPKINRVQSVRTKKVYEAKLFVHQYGMISTIYNKKYFNTFLKEMNLLNSWILQDNEYKINCGIKMEFDWYKNILYSVDTTTGEIKTASLKNYKTLSEILFLNKQTNN